MKNKIAVVILLLFVIAIFGWLSYVLFFPKTTRTGTSKFITQTMQVKASLAKKVVTDHINPVKVTHDLFSPLVIKLSQSDLEKLLKAPVSGLRTDERLSYVSGVKSNALSMVTLSLNGKNATFNFNLGNTRFWFNGKEYVIVYFDPTLEGAIIMDLSDGKLSIVTFRGMIVE